jgi:Protein of unknown function (DUF4232)
MTNKRLPALAGTVIASVLLAGCGSGSGTAAGGTGSAGSSGGSPGTVAGSGSPTDGGGSPGSATASPAVPGMPGLARCLTAGLKITLDTGAGGGAAGSTYLPVDFTNESAAACGMYGFPGVSFVTAPGTAGRQVGTAAQRNGSFDSVGVKLEPGGVAHAWLQVAQAANYPAAVCHAMPVQWLRVYPPDDRTAGYASGQFDACQGPGAPVLTVMPVRSGKGQQGTVP